MRIKRRAAGSEATRRAPQAAETEDPMAPKPRSRKHPFARGRATVGEAPARPQAAPAMAFAAASADRLALATTEASAIVRL
jgi:hypothetical protein